MSLVSAWSRNWFYLCGKVEAVETGEILEIANVHAVVMQVAENMVGWRKRLGEYPTLSAIRFVSIWLNCRLFVEVTATRDDTSLCGFPLAGNSELTDFHVGLVPINALAWSDVANFASGQQSPKSIRMESELGMAGGTLVTRERRIDWDQRQASYQ